MYETPECHLLDKKSIKLEGVQDFQWSPAAPIISACQAEQSSGNLPARVVLLKIPERTELRQKNLFSVSGESPPSSREVQGRDIVAKISLQLPG